ncbi:MAG: hypothetical protein JXN65_02245 [Clostridia bacterium]|nr:hypothetical protein [Clostridia bacterium]
MEWKTAWSYVPIDFNSNIGTLTNTTQRVFLKNNIEGNRAKIKFTNLYSKHPLVFESVTMGKREPGTDEVTGITPVTKDGSGKITVGAGEEFYSDEASIAIGSGDEIVISIYVKQSTDIYSVCSTWNAKSWHSSFESGGDFTKEPALHGLESIDAFPSLNMDENKPTVLFGFSEVMVLTNKAVKTIALFGDSITHMSYYSDPLIEILYNKYPCEVTVLNRGIGGNRLLKDYSRVEEIPGGGTIFGMAGVQRFEKDVYSSGSVDKLVVLIGINDFTHPYALNHPDEEVTSEEYISGMAKIADIACSHGSKVYFGTLTPFISGSESWHQKTENLRSCANEWIKKQMITDGVIDFDLAVRKQDKHDEMQDDCHLGDGLHPNETGGKKMAEAAAEKIFE